MGIRAAIARSPREGLGGNNVTEITYTRRMEADATSARLMWAQLGVTNQTEASIKIAGLLAQREVIERLEARITELKQRPPFVAKGDE